MTTEYGKEVKDAIRACTRCALHKLYSGPVPVSLGQPGFLCIGEAPGAEEDQNGVPFSGPSGRFLRLKLNQAGVPPGRTSFANLISCRLHDNRDPSDYEVQRCRGNLLAQINLAQPNVIIALGSHALSGLYPHADPKKMGKDRARVLYYGSINGKSVWIYPTWHPAYIMRPNGRPYEETWLEHLREAARIHSEKPVFPETCRVSTCSRQVHSYDVMAGAWCKHHYKEIPRQIWQDEMFDTDTYDPKNGHKARIAKYLLEHHRTKAKAREL